MLHQERVCQGLGFIATKETWDGRAFPYRPIGTKSAAALETCMDLPRLFELLVRNVKGLAIFTLDSQGRVATWNASAKGLLGYEDGDIIGRPADLFFTAEDRERHEPERELEIAVRQGQASDDRWIVRKDGSTFWCSGLTIALRDGGVHGFVKIMRDQTDMKDALDQVQELNNKLHKMIADLRQSQEQLQEKVLELEQFEEVAVGRELEMIKLKRHLKDAEAELTRLRSESPR
jgi:PAS domain S-box-containing protein